MSLTIQGKNLVHQYKSFIQLKKKKLTRFFILLFLRSVATSQLQPTHARKAFPCFDEPSFKAKFSIKVVYPSSGNYSALSNMNLEVKSQL